jgi:predicted enzyme related to lactoylglutathione lyase
MIKNISHVSLLVKNYDEAITFYIEKFGFILISNDPMPQMGENMRWVVISPAKDNQTMITLTLDTEESTVGKQCGEHPFLILSCTDIYADISDFESKGVNIKSPIGDQPWGKDCLIEDLYGNIIYVVEAPKI